FRRCRSTSMSGSRLGHGLESWPEMHRLLLYILDAGSGLRRLRAFSAGISPSGSMLWSIDWGRRSAIFFSQFLSGIADDLEVFINCRHCFEHRSVLAGADFGGLGSSLRTANLVFRFLLR